MYYLIASNLIFILYALIEGFREGFYWFFKVNSKKKTEFEIHPIFAAQRGMVILLLATNVLLLTDLNSALINILSNALLFSFFHNGIYYTTRNKLDPNIYKLGWREQSTTSTAKMTKFFTYRNRTICAIIGALCTLFTILFIK